MKPEIFDWKLLRGSLIFFLISLCVSTSLVYGGYFFKERMELEFNRANAAFRSISSRYLAVDEEEKLIRSYLPRFIDLYESGMIGNEQRLNWVEVLRAAGDEIRMPSLSYQIESQQVYTPDFPLNMGKYRLYSSKMSLNMQLLHEGDLFRILDELDLHARGNYSLSSCSINQTLTEITDNPDAGNISARCDLQWFTIRLADGRQVEI